MGKLKITVHCYFIPGLKVLFYEFFSDIVKDSSMKAHPRSHVLPIH